MTLHVRTTHVKRYRGHLRGGPDLLDITRGGGPDLGKVFAPSNEILGPAIKTRQRADKMRREIGERWQTDNTIDAEIGRAMRREADRIERAAWAAYVPLYVEEMRASYRANRDAWERLLSFSDVALGCYCADHWIALRDGEEAPVVVLGGERIAIDVGHCHRRVLAAVILPRLGAVDGGEI